MTLPRRVLLAMVAGAVGCSAGQAAPTVVANYDTLSTGTVVVNSPEPTGWSDSSRGWRVEEVTRFGGADGSASELVEPSNMGVDGAGRIYVADRKPPSIKVFDSTGALVRVIGREGSGPGEFRVAFVAVRGNVVVAHDPMQSRTSVFDTAGTYLRSWNSSCCYWTEIHIDRSMRIYIPTASPRDSSGRIRRGYTRYRVDGSLIDTLWVPVLDDESKAWKVSSKDGKSAMSTSIPFTPQQHIAYHPGGGFVTGFSAAYRLNITATGSDSNRIVIRAHTPDPIPDAVRQARTDETLKWVSEQYGSAIASAAIRVSDVPTTYPAFETIRVGEDDHIWVRRFSGTDSTRTSYDVFRPDGAWLGMVRVPVAVPEWGSQYFGTGTVYAATEDADGRPMIVKLRVVP